MHKPAHHKNYHQRTAALTAQFFRFTRLPPTLVNVDCFMDVCTHLNPLVILPTIHELKTALKTKDSEQGPCVLCGTENPPGPTLRLEKSDAALFLTSSVLADKRTLAQAKRAMVEETLKICQVHIKESHLDMIRLLNWSLDDPQNIQLDQLRGGNIIYNKLLNMNNLFNEEMLVKVGSADYQALVIGWLTPRKPKFTRRKRNLWEDPAYASASDLEPEMDMDDVAPELEREVEQEPMQDISLETVNEMLQQALNRTNAFSNLDPENEKSPEKPLEETLEKQVKLEEPDYDEHAAAPIVVNPSPPVAMKPVIYTLKNGKKVMKAPFAATLIARRGIGKLVTHRIVTKRVIGKEASPPMFQGIMRKEEKPELFGETSSGSLTLS